MGEVVWPVRALPSHLLRLQAVRDSSRPLRTAQDSLHSVYCSSPLGDPEGHSRESRNRAADSAGWLKVVVPRQKRDSSGEHIRGCPFRPCHSRQIGLSSFPSEKDERETQLQDSVAVLDHCDSALGTRSS